MPRYEYKVVPAPTKGLKAKGVRTPEARFSNAIQALMNKLAEDGWEYQRAETLPSVERAGLTSTTTEWRNVLVFRRLHEDDLSAFAPELLPPPDAAFSAGPEPTSEPEEEPVENVAEAPSEEQQAETEGQDEEPADEKAEAEKATT